MTVMKPTDIARIELISPNLPHLNTDAANTYTVVLLSASCYLAIIY